MIHIFVFYPLTIGRDYHSHSASFKSRALFPVMSIFPMRETYRYGQSLVLLLHPQTVRLDILGKSMGRRYHQE